MATDSDDVKKNNKLHVKWNSNFKNIRKKKLAMVNSDRRSERPTEPTRIISYPTAFATHFVDYIMQTHMQLSLYGLFAVQGSKRRAYGEMATTSYYHHDGYDDSLAYEDVRLLTAAEFVTRKLAPFVDVCFVETPDAKSVLYKALNEFEWRVVLYHAVLLNKRNMLKTTLGVDSDSQIIAICHTFEQTSTDVIDMASCIRHMFKGISDVYRKEVKVKSCATMMKSTFNITQNDDDNTFDLRLFLPFPGDAHSDQLTKEYISNISWTL